MLTVTDNAQTLVKDLTDKAEVPDTGGVRIAPAAAAGQLEVSIAPEPQPGDEVVGDEGARVFVEEQTAALLADSTLDAQGGEQPGFVLTQQD